MIFFLNKSACVVNWCEWMNVIYSVKRSKDYKSAIYKYSSFTIQLIHASCSVAANLNSIILVFI